MSNIVLIGFMGCGKTTVGIRLSYAMRRAFLDTDKLIEKEQEKEISRIFAQEGEEKFRQLETEMLEKLAGTGQNYSYRRWDACEKRESLSVKEAGSGGLSGSETGDGI